MIKNVIFDFDGTVSDSGKAVKDSFAYALQELGITPEKEKLDMVIGPPLVESFRDIFHVPEKDIPEAIKKYRYYHDIYGIPEYRMYEGFDKLLVSLKKHRIKCYIATSKPIEYTERILLNFGILSLFDFVAGNDFAETRPTKESVLRYLFDSCPDCRKLNTVMVGDRKYDVFGAKSLGIPCIGVEYGFAPEGELKTFGADYIANDMKQLEEIILSI